MTLADIQKAFEAVNMKQGFTVRMHNAGDGVVIIVNRDGLLFSRMNTVCPNFTNDFNRVMRHISIPADEMEPVAHEDQSIRWRYNGSPVPAKIRIVTNGGMILIAACSDVIINALGGLRCNSWTMRLNLIDNRAYPADINPDHIKTVEYVA